MENEENKIVDVESKPSEEEKDSKVEKNVENIKDASGEDKAFGVNPEEFNKPALTSFILSVVAAFVFAGNYPGSITAFILSLVSLKAFSKKGLKSTKNPYKVFGKIGYILSIVILVLSVLSFVGWTYYWIFAIGVAGGFIK